MKVEEAIQRLKQWLKVGSDAITEDSDGMTEEKLGYLEGWFHKSDEEAFEMGIAALEKGPEYLERIDHQMQYISKLEGFIKMNIPEWILIKDRLPDERQKVLLQYHPFNNDNAIQYAVTYRYNNVNWYKLNNIVPIEWMIFPEPYIEVGSRQQDKGE